MKKATKPKKFKPSKTAIEIAELFTPSEEEIRKEVARTSYVGPMGLDELVKEIDRGVQVRSRELEPHKERDGRWRSEIKDSLALKVNKVTRTENAKKLSLKTRQLGANTKHKDAVNAGVEEVGCLKSRINDLWTSNPQAEGWNAERVRNTLLNTGYLPSNNIDPRGRKFLNCVRRAITELKQ